MAVVHLTGQDAIYWGWDSSQFRSEEEKALLIDLATYYSQPLHGFHQDGLIYLIPEMNFRPWDIPAEHPLKQKSFFVHLPWGNGLMGDFWTLFYIFVSKELKWRCFNASPTEQQEKAKYVFYKFGQLPQEPDLLTSEDGRSFKTILGPDWEHAVEQGGILYQDFRTWDITNQALALHDDPLPFLSAVSDRKILL